MLLKRKSSSPESDRYAKRQRSTVPEKENIQSKVICITSDNIPANPIILNPSYPAVRSEQYSTEPLKDITGRGLISAAPDVSSVERALDDLTARLRFSQHPNLHPVVSNRLRDIKLLCYNFLHAQNESRSSTWTSVSLQTAASLGRGSYYAQQLRMWARAFVTSRQDPPKPAYPSTSGTSLIDNKEFTMMLEPHLRSIGAYVCAQDIVDYTKRPEIQAKFKFQLQKPISHTTAKRWMPKLDYAWKATPQGMYIDGHERSDVVTYRTKVYLPAMARHDSKLRQWNKHGEEVPLKVPVSRHTVLWFHDESTFYAHDRRKIRWVNKNEAPTLIQKGPGASLMVAEFVSADYGFLRSPDGEESARILLRAGKNRDGYFDNKSVHLQLTQAMAILKKYFPRDDHVLIYDNATTHVKRLEGSVSALGMTKGPSSKFGVEVNQTTPDGKLMYGSDGKVLKKKIRMMNGRLADGREQEFYYEDGEPLAGQFKGMQKILEERDYNVGHLKAQCGQKFSDCAPGSVDCCCRRIMYNEHDFVNVDSILEAEARNQGFEILFLPKFHPELNFIEQCWGWAKNQYRTFPSSSSEEDLERNVVLAIDSIPLKVIRRFANRSLRFTDAYRRGLVGHRADWAAKQSSGHREIPEAILAEFDSEDDQ